MLITGANCANNNANNASYYNNSGLARYNLGDYSGSIPDYQKALEIAPDNSMIHVNLGLSYEKLNKPISACDSYNNARNLNNKEIIKWFNNDSSKWCKVKK